MGRHPKPFTQAVLTAPKRHFRSTPINGHHRTGTIGPVRAIKRRHQTKHTISRIASHSLTDQRGDARPSIAHPLGETPSLP
jgi:hypothetical protein